MTKFGLLLVAASSLLCILLPPSARGLENGLGRVPVMGWLSWERYACETDCETYPDECISESLYLRQAKALVDGGYAKAGYTFVNVDDCMLNRTADGRLEANPERFPHGIKWLTDQIHAMGLKFGIYSDVGNASCAGFAAFDVPTGPGPVNATAQYLLDVEQMADWGVDSIKVDGCNADVSSMNVSYPRLGKALTTTGSRPIMYACSWPDYVRSTGLPLQLGLVAENCNYWRIFSDIDDSYESVRGIARFWANNSEAFADVAGPGQFFDADMLMIGGTGLSAAQEEMQMALWSVWAVPLLMSNDVAAGLAASSAQTLLNPTAIAVNQDPLGRAGRLVPHQSTKPDSTDVWSRPLQNGRFAFVAVNFDDFGGPAHVTVDAADLGLNPGQQFNATDVFRGGAPVSSTPDGRMTLSLLSTSCKFMLIDVDDQ